MGNFDYYFHAACYHAVSLLLLLRCFCVKIACNVLTGIITLFADRNLAAHSNRRGNLVSA